ncbi:MAG: protein BatD [Fidelibacterota bacterium]|nr:MAG: protein BatD [Candidatus Neomarinimicrobiota bacterium]
MPGKLPLLLPLLLLLPLSSITAQPKVQAIVSDTRIVEGQSFTMEVRVEDGEIQSVSQEGLAAFRILTGPTTSRSVQIINGAITSTSSYRWTLLPRKMGKQIIPSLAVKVGGTTLHTTPVQIEVLSATAASKAGSGDSDRSVFLVADVDRKKVYRGDQITVSWTLYTQQNISGWEIVSLPNLTGFWTEELFAPNKLQLRERVVEGRRYYTAVVRRIATFPTQSGELEVDPLILKIGVQLRKRRVLDPFFDDFSIFRPGQVEHRTVSSPAVVVEVAPTPAVNRPSDYSGIVGRYSLSGNLNPQEVVQDEAVTLTLTISGEGNFKTLDAPPVDFPRDLEVFDPKVNSEPSLGDVIGGSKTVEYIIIPRRASTFIIPQVRLPYFNPAAEQYEVKTTGPFTLNVLPREEAGVSSPGYTRREVALLGKDIRFVKSGRPRWLRTGKGWYTSSLFILNVATVLLLGAPWLGTRARSLVTAARPGLQAWRALSVATAIVDEAQGEPMEIYSELSRALTRYLNHKLGRDTSEYTMDDVRELLTSRGVSPAHQEILVQILERAAAARFAPVRAGNAETDRQALKEVLSEVESQWSA